MYIDSNIITVHYYIIISITFYLHSIMMNNDNHNKI